MKAKLKTIILTALLLLSEQGIAGLSIGIPARHHLIPNIRRFLARLKIRAMKFTIYTIFIFLFTALVAATAEDSVSPQFRAAIVCYNGKLDSGSSCAVNPASAGQPLAKSGKMTCGFPGRVSEITWSFVERRDGNDVYSSFSDRDTRDSYRNQTD